MKKLLALVLTLCMALSILPAMAETTTPAEEDAKLSELLKELFTDIQTSVASVDLSKLSDQSLSGEDSNYAVFEQVLENILKDVGEEAEGVKEALEFIEGLKETIGEDAQETAEAIFSMILLGLAGEEEEADKDVDVEEAIGGIIRALTEALEENDLIAKAVEETGSALFDLIASTYQHIRDEAAAGKEPYEALGEEIFASFEAEIAKVLEYLKGLDADQHPNKALDLVELFHEAIDDIHKYVDGDELHEEEEWDADELIQELLGTVMDAVMGANIAEIKEKAGENFEMDGGVFGLYEKILAQISEEMEKQQAEAGKGLMDVLAFLGTLEETAEISAEDVTALFSALAQEIESHGDAGEEKDPEVSVQHVAELLTAVFETLEENQQIMDAVKETGSKAVEMLTGLAEVILKSAEESGVFEEITEKGEEAYQQFESELAKITAYLEGNNAEGATKSLRFLELVHDMVHDVHSALTGHEHAHE